MAAESEQRRSRLATLICFFVPFALYLSTAARTIQGGDAGELGLLSQIGGVAHPPGYPLYTLFLRLFGHLPFGPPFFHAALVSVLAGSAAVAIIQRVGYRLTGNAMASSLAALVLAVSIPLWRLSGVPEVFSLHALITALVMLLTLRTIESGRGVFTLGLVLGLGGANHQTTLFAVPLALVALIGVRQLRAVGVLVLGGLLGLTPYLLLMVWGRADPVTSWIWGDTTTFQGLLDHILRRSYGTFHLYASGSTGVSGVVWIRQAWLTLASSHGYVLFLMGIGGALLLWRSHRLFAIGLFLSLLISGVIFPGEMNRPLAPVNLEIAERFFLMPLVLFTPLVAVGLATAWQRSATLTGVVSLVIVLVGGATHLHDVNWRADTNVDRYLIAATSELPPGAIVLGQSDTLRPAVAWMQRVERLRPDIVYVDAIMFATRWHHDAVQRALGTVLPFRPSKWPPGELAAVLSRVRPTFLIPDLAAHAHDRVSLDGWGLLYKVRTSPLERADTDLQQDRLTLATKRFGPPSEPADVWSAHILESMAAPWSDLASSEDALGQSANAEAARNEAAKFLLPGVLAVENGTAE